MSVAEVKSTGHWCSRLRPPPLEGRYHGWKMRVPGRKADHENQK